MAAAIALIGTENVVVIHTGGCHCGRVRFEVEAPANLTLSDCNCSVCVMTGYQHLIVTKESFRLLQGENELTTYTFNTGVAKHRFCKHCGIKSFYVPRSHPHGISVNARCLESATITGIEVTTFDGQNWEKNIANRLDAENRRE